MATFALPSLTTTADTQVCTTRRLTCLLLLVIIAALASLDPHICIVPNILLLGPRTPVATVAVLVVAVAEILLLVVVDRRQRQTGAQRTRKGNKHREGECEKGGMISDEGIRTKQNRNIGRHTNDTENEITKRNEQWWDTCARCNTWTDIM